MVRAMIATVHAWKRFAWVLILLAAGCSRPSTVGPKANSIEDRLLKIGTAHRNATRRLGHAPKDFQELQSRL
jgi:hypothetical protein